jgi:hypothetical protein
MVNYHGAGYIVLDVFRGKCLADPLRSLEQKKRYEFGWRPKMAQLDQIRGWTIQLRMVRGL